MYVKSDKLTLRILDSRSLKDKRSVIKSLITKVHNKFNVSIAEVDSNDVLNLCELGLSIVSHQKNQCDQVFDSILHFIENNYPVELCDIESY